MMTHQLEVSIIAAPIAAMDRRALSQAWYSALRLERGEAKHAVSGRLRPNGPAFVPQAGQGEFDAAFERCVQRYRARLTASTSAIAPPRTGTAIAAAQTLPLSRRIERTFLRQKAPLRRATFSLERGGARVHIIVQTSANTVTLVALCRPEMCRVVAQALTQARLALAARGIECNQTQSGVKPCF